MRRNILSGLEVDRRAVLRTDPERLQDLWRGRDVRVLPVWRSQHIVQARETSVTFVSVDRFGGPEGAILLGQTDDTVYFAVDVSELDEPVAELGLAEEHEVKGLREVAGLVSQSDGALLAYANGMLGWHRRHLYCGRCGGTTRAAQAGHVRVCEACDAEHFPRTDPAVIMLVTDGERCLLGRQPSWPVKIYSTLAGFVEPGESLEEAVAREVAEETGVRVDKVRYHSSQPWPFPSSLMVGFTARAVTSTIRRETDELEDARFFTRHELRRGVVRLPSTISIARRLIEDWLG